MKTLLFVVLAVLAAYIGFGALLYSKQRSMMYFPTLKVEHPYSEQVFRHQGQSIVVVVANEGGDDAIIYLGGNGESVALSAPRMAALFPERTVYFVNYRGYGGSSGSPEEKGIYADALYVYDRIAPSHNRVALIGRSLGSAVAMHVAVHRQVSALALVTPFDSIANIVKRSFPTYPVGYLLKDKYDSLARVNQVSARTLVLAAERDRVVEWPRTENLIHAFPPEQLTVHVIPRARHNTISEYREYTSALSEFIRSPAD